MVKVRFSPKLDVLDQAARLLGLHKDAQPYSDRPISIRINYAGPAGTGADSQDALSEPAAELPQKTPEPVSPKLANVLERCLAGRKET
ncbi:MAG: hypothetical protein QM765_21005 [Myxococcales bacterium]